MIRSLLMGSLEPKQPAERMTVVDSFQRIAD